MKDEGAARLRAVDVARGIAIISVILKRATGSMEEPASAGERLTIIMEML